MSPGIDFLCVFPCVHGAGECDKWIGHRCAVAEHGSCCLQEAVGVYAEAAHGLRADDESDSRGSGAFDESCDGGAGSGVLTDCAELIEKNQRPPAIAVDGEFADHGEQPCCDVRCTLRRSSLGSSASSKEFHPPSPIEPWGAVSCRRDALG